MNNWLAFGLLFLLAACTSSNRAADLSEPKGVARVTFHPVLANGQPDRAAKVVRIARVDPSGQKGDTALVSRFAGLTAEIPYGRYDYLVQCEKVADLGTIEVYSPKEFILIDCGLRPSEFEAVSGNVAFRTRGQLTPAPPALSGHHWLTFISAIGNRSSLKLNRPSSALIGPDGSFEVYGMREGRYVAVLFNDGKLIKSFEFEFRTLVDQHKPLMFQLDVPAR